MGELSSLAKATVELEELYLGIPDDSVNLTFRDLVDMKQIPNATTPILGVTESTRHGLVELERSVALAYENDDVSVISMASTYRSKKGQSRRPGIPHSNICTICTTSTYIFRRRCLVCGRVYCKQCAYMGMGEMKEGRKCVLCLGRRFSHRYIKRAGKTSCCWRYPSTVKQAELKWAEKGPRKRGERSAYGYEHSAIGVMSRSRSPAIANLRTPTRAHTHTNSTTPSFVATTPARAYSPYTPTHHHLPL